MSGRWATGSRPFFGLVQPRRWSGDAFDRSKRVDWRNPSLVTLRKMVGYTHPTGDRGPVALERCPTVVLALELGPLFAPSCAISRHALKIRKPFSPIGLQRRLALKMGVRRQHFFTNRSEGGGGPEILDFRLVILDCGSRGLRRFQGAGWSQGVAESQGDALGWFVVVPWGVKNKAGLAGGSLVHCL